MGNIMKKILHFGCGVIAFNDEYVCAGGNKIGIFNSSSNEVCGLLTGAKNIISMAMDDEYVYVKTTNGIYSMFDLKTHALQCNGYCQDRKNTSHDGKFFLYERGVILDVIALKDDFYYLIKYDLELHNYQKKCITKSNFSYKDCWVDSSQKKAYILFVEKCCLNHPQTNCYIFVINTVNLQIEKEIPLTFEHGVFPIGLISTNSLLSNNMHIVNFLSMERTLLDSHNFFQDPTCGYFVRMNSLSPERLILVFSNRILIYNLMDNNLMYQYDCRFGENAVCVDNKVYIATWDGFFEVENTVDG